MVAVVIFIALLLAIEPTYKAFIEARNNERELSNSFKKARDEVSKRKRT